MGLAIQQLRVGQLMMSWARKLTGASKSRASWAGMQLFMEQRVAPGGPRKEAVYANFKKNLADILRAGQNSGAKVILSTVAVNLKDCAPFASVTRDGLSEPRRTETATLLRAATEAQAHEDLPQALQYLERATMLDTNNAENQFHLGSCFVKLTNAPAARECFERARDLDTLPFRADSRLNNEIARAAKDFAGPGLVFFDAVRFFATNSPAGVPGAEYFYEHVHFNSDGNFRLAKQWAEQIEHLPPDSITKTATAAWASQDVCEQRLALTDWNRLTVWEDMSRRLNQPPFTNQLNHSAQLDVVREQIRQIRQRMNASDAARARDIYTRATKRAPDDFRLHENFAEFLEAIRRACAHPLFSKGVVEPDILAATRDYLSPQRMARNFLMAYEAALENPPAKK